MALGAGSPALPRDGRVSKVRVGVPGVGLLGAVRVGAAAGAAGSYLRGVRGSSAIVRVGAVPGAVGNSERNLRVPGVLVLPELPFCGVLPRPGVTNPLRPAGSLIGLPLFLGP